MNREIKAVLLGACSIALSGYVIRKIASAEKVARRLSLVRTDLDSSAPLERKFGNHTRDIVEEASWESFPASDPPPWGR